MDYGSSQQVLTKGQDQLLRGVAGMWVGGVWQQVECIRCWQASWESFLVDHCLTPDGCTFGQLLGRHQASCSAWSCSAVITFASSPLWLMCLVVDALIGSGGMLCGRDNFRAVMAEVIFQVQNYIRRFIHAMHRLCTHVCVIPLSRDSQPCFAASLPPSNPAGNKLVTISQYRR